MKKIFLAIMILISVSLNAQVVPSVTFQSQDWAWLIGKNISSINSDSASASEFRKIREAIIAANPATWTTNVVINNVPEWVVMAFYRTVKTSGAGEIAARYSAITTQIESKAQLAAQITAFNARITEDYNRSRNAGKYIVMDQ